MKGVTLKHMIRIVALDKIKDILARAMETICVVLIMALTILSIGAVFLRYAFDITFIQNEELITFLFTGTVFLGIVPVLQKKEHVNVTQIQNCVSGMARKCLIVFQYVVIITVQILFLYASYYWISTNLSFKTPGLRIPYWVVYWVVPFGSLLSAVIGIIDLIETILTPASAEIFAKRVKK